MKHLFSLSMSLMAMLSLGVAEGEAQSVEPLKPRNTSNHRDIFQPRKLTTEQHKIRISGGKTAVMSTKPMANRSRRSAKSADSAPILYGLTFDEYDNYEVVSFPASADMELTEFFSHPDLEPQGGAVCAEGKLYVNYTYEEYFYTQTEQYVFDTKTWKVVDERYIEYDEPYGNCHTYDPTTGQVYLQQLYDEGVTILQAFCTMDLATGEATPLFYHDTNETMLALAAAPDGRIYGINTNGMLQEIDKNTGDLRKIGNTDIKPGYLQSAFIDPQTGIFYWASCDDNGISALYTVDLNDGHATLISTFPDNREMLCLWMEEAPVADDAPAAISNLHFELNGPSLTGDICFQAPSLTEGGQELADAVTCHILLDGKSYEVEAQPGQEISYTFTVSNADLYQASVYAYNEAGKGRKTEINQWIGPDYPSGVRNLKLEIVGDEARLTWQPPLIGIHGGYINPDEVTYCIYGQGADNTWLMYYEDTTYVEDVSAIVGKIGFSVRTVYMELAGETVNSNTINRNGALSLPLSFSYTSRDNFADCTIIDANNDGVKWTESIMGFAQLLTGDASTANDDWIITPAILFDVKGRYNIDIELFSRNGWFSPETFEVYLGKAPTVEAQTLKVGDGTLTGINEYKTIEFTATIEETGTYYLGLRATSSDGWEMRATHVNIKADAALTAPEQVSDFAITPADLGELKATLSMVAPATDVEGNALEGLQEIEVKRGREVIGHIAQPVPGQACTYVDEQPKLGDNTYTVTAIDLNGNRGAEVSKTAYVGVDVPDFVDNLVFRQEGDKGVLTWDAPTKGYNGGYIDPSKVYYAIYETSYYNLIATTGYGETSFEAFLTIYDNQQYPLDLAVEALNEAGSAGGAAISNAIIVGNPYPLPFAEHFNKGGLTHSWFVQGEAYEDGGWSPEAYSEDGNTGILRYWAEWDDEEQEYISGKISLAEAQAPILRFRVMGYGNNADLQVKVSTDLTQGMTVLKTINMRDLPHGEWVSVELPLDQYLGAEFVHVAFHAQPKENGVSCNIVLDDIEVRDVYAHDAAIISYAVSGEEAEVGKSSVTIGVRIENRGTDALHKGDYTIDFYADDRLIESQTGEPLAYYEHYDALCLYEPALKDANIVKLRAVLVYDADEYLSDNTSPETEVYVIKPYCPVVTDLAATEDKGKVKLYWSQPDLSGTPIRTVTEDFESYRPMQLDHFGEWTAIDKDQQMTSAPSWLFFADKYAPMAWYLFNTDMVKVGTGTLEKKWPAHSGKQLLVSLAPYYSDNDDWLITPELSGNSQTIKFWSRSSSEEAGHEMFSVYYSTTGCDVESMTAIDDEIHYVPTDWTEYSFEVPAGAKYFAIRCVSHNREAMLVDDVTYEEAAHPLEVEFLGYNLYRNNELVNDQPLTTTGYEDNFNGKASYHVTCLYDLGESEPSNTVVVDTVVGIQQLSDESQEATFYDLMGRKASVPQQGFLYIKK